MTEMNGSSKHWRARTVSDVKTSNDGLPLRVHTLRCFRLKETTSNEMVVSSHQSPSHLRDSPSGSIVHVPDVPESGRHSLSSMQHAWIAGTDPGVAISGMLHSVLHPESHEKP